MNELAGKVAVITGSTRGFGLAVARLFAAEGAAVVVSSRSAEAVQRAVTDLRASGGRVSGLACDVADLAQVEALAAHARETFGRIDVWVNNAGVSAPYGPSVHVPVEDFEAALRTNIQGTYHGALVALREFLPRRSGKLINVLGRGDREPVPLQNAYASSKAWVRTFTRALAREYEHSGVGVFLLNPGIMPTDLMTRVKAVAGYEERLNALGTVVRMWGNPPEVAAREALWLASRATDNRTGVEKHVLTRSRLLQGVLREGVRRLTRRSGATPAPRVAVVPSALPEKTA